VRRALALAFALVLLAATPAFAHVSVSPSEVAEESYATLTFRVSNESDSEDERDRAAAGDDGADGTDPLAFASLFVAGAAAVAAVAALIFGTKRAPA
jgi:hypothetical protein